MPDLRLEDVPALLRQAQEALIWCSGSADFGPSGQARVGWLAPDGPAATIQAIDQALAGVTFPTPGGGRIEQAVALATARIAASAAPLTLAVWEHIGGPRPDGQVMLPTGRVIVRDADRPAPKHGWRKVAHVTGAPPSPPSRGPTP